MIAILEEHGLVAVAASIAAEHHITVAEMFSARRTMPLPAARGQFYGYLRALGWSYPQIGLLVGKDHQTIIGAVARHGVKRPPRAA